MRAPWIFRRPRKGLFGNELLDHTDDGQQHAAASDVGEDSGQVQAAGPGAAYGLGTAYAQHTQ